MGGDSQESHVKHIEQALANGSHAWPPHAYSLVGPILLYYIQGMFMSVWHMESGLVEHVPIVWSQDVANYRKHQIKFERSVRALERSRV